VETFSGPAGVFDVDWSANDKIAVATAKVCLFIYLFYFILFIYFIYLFIYFTYFIYFIYLFFSTGSGDNF
jgi:hypothetical protein